MNREDIKRRAYRIWQEKCRKGIPDNSKDNNKWTNWFEAELEILQEIVQRGEVGE